MWQEISSVEVGQTTDNIEEKAGKSQRTKSQGRGNAATKPQELDRQVAFEKLIEKIVEGGGDFRSVIVITRILYFWNQLSYFSLCFPLDYSLIFDEFPIPSPMNGLKDDNGRSTWTWIHRKVKYRPTPNARAPFVLLVAKPIKHIYCHLVERSHGSKVFPQKFEESTTASQLSKVSLLSNGWWAGT